MPADHEYVPLMFQAQVDGRSQIQRLIPSQREKQQAYDWARQWQEACDTRKVPTFENHVQTRECQFTWRMVTNSGQDAGVIRPVIGDRGWAYFPGSSMKGAFLRACRRMCPPDEVQQFCGGEDTDGELHPGILRFHGGYPKNAEWLDDSLVDVVHPQEDWQTKNQGKHSALIQISLYQPIFVFGISSIKTLTDAEWETVWRVWQATLEQGIGSRVSAGYGQIATHTGNKLIGFGLLGQGQTSKLINGWGEFRSNLFKAALRGHTRRIFSGIADEQTADKLTKLLWGGIGKKDAATIGMLGISFNAPDLELDEWVGRNRNNRVPTYETGDATLDLLLMKPNLTSEQQNELKVFVIRLVRFAMLLGGFGKAWRRADHRLFMPDYDRQMIGCHWQFTQRSQKLYIPLSDDLKGVTLFLDGFCKKAQEFPWLRDLPNPGKPASEIREAWHQGNVQVWGRLADDEKDSLAIDWLHQDYKQAQTIKSSELTGKMGKIGRIWHRMYPRFRLLKKEGKEIWRPTDQYVELLTIFPNVSEGDGQRKNVQDFLRFLDQETDFKQLW